MKKISGFTLIEMLTVIAITAVLLTIIVLPIFQSFNLTRAAEAFADAQAQARFLTSKIAREIGQAVSVRPTNNLIATSLNSTSASLPNSSLVVQVPGPTGQITSPSGPLIEVVLPYTKLDLVPPAQGQDPNSIGPTGGTFRDPVTGKIDPTLIAPKGQVSTPTTPGMAMVRYAVGLRDPLSTYNDPYTGLLMARAGGRDNLFVLYRITMVPYVNQGQGAVPNTALFDVDPNGNPVLDDPRFLVPDRDPNTGKILQNNHNLRLYHFLSQRAPWEPADTPGNITDHSPYFARSVVQTEVSRYDMILPQYNLVSRQVTVDPVVVSGKTIDVPRLTPLVQFRPTIISNDPSAGQEAIRQGEESNSASLIGPDVYKTEYGLWNNAIVRTFLGGFLAGDPNRDQYVMGYTGLNGAPGFSEYAYDPANGGEFNSGFEFFDTYTYDLAVGAGQPYPFTQAALQANSRSGWLNQAQVYRLFTPYHVLSGPGKIVASFGISEVGVNSLPNDAYEDPNRPNLPTLWLPDSYGPFSPNNDPAWNSTTNTWSGSYPWSPVGTQLWTPINSGVPNPYDINEAFNQAWYVHQDLQSGVGVQRFIDLRVVPNEDGTYSPLYPGNVAAGTITGFQVPQPDGSMMSRCRIVPGSETVYGPDQKPGPNLGRPVRYTRTTHAPGPDQYRINYTDQKEPSDPGTGMVSAASYQLLGLTAGETAGFDPTKYDPTNFTSATIEPRYKVGYLQLNSDPNLPLPNGYTLNGNPVPVPFKVSFRFQFTGTLAPNTVPAGAGTTDVFEVDYDTRELMQVLLTIRNYPQSDLPNPQSITLKSTASIRNFAR